MTSAASRAMTWLRSRDRNLAALRRAARAAIVMPAMFALGYEVIGNPAIATFAAFGSFAMLLLVDYGGPMRERLIAQGALGAAGAVLVCIGTAASRSTWLATLVMAVVGVGVLFAGVVSSVLASSTTALLIAFILPVTLPGPLSSIPDRVAGWGLAAGASFLAVAILWPAPARDPLRAAAAGVCRLLSARLRADVAFMLGEGITAEEREQAVAQSIEAVEGLNRLFFATPFRPTGLNTSARAVVRLVDELDWLNAVLAQTPTGSLPPLANRPVCAVRGTAASVLERSAELLETSQGDPEPLRSELGRLRQCLVGLEANATLELPPGMSPDGRPASELVSALDPSFRAQELTFAVSQIAANTELAALAERRSWFDRVLGRQPAGLSNTLAAAQERAAGHFDRHSIWLRNSIRGGVGLALAVAVASETGVQHSFWVVLGTLSVLRSNALSTGQSVLRALLGTAAGFAIGAVLILVVGTNTTVLWFLLPPAILLAGFAPAAISFAAGQAAFTLTLVILFNILQPVGWQVGLIRVEDAAIGCAVSLVVGVLLWPRGAAAALGGALAEAYRGSADYLVAAVEFGLGRCDRGVPTRPSPNHEVITAAAAARRLDDAFRTYLAERGAKPVSLADVTSLVTGVAGLRLAADAVVDLWQRDEGTSVADRAGAAHELRAIRDRVTAWYADFAGHLTDGGALPAPVTADEVAPGPLVEAVRRDLAGAATGVGVRVIWTADHIDAARRLQGTLIAPASGLVTQMRDPLGLERLELNRDLLGPRLPFRGAVVELSPPVGQEVVNRGGADDLRFGHREHRGVEDEGARLRAAEAAVERDQLLEGAAGFERRVVEAADHDVGHMRESVRAQEMPGRIRREGGKRIVAFHPSVCEIVRPARTERDGSMLGRADEQPTDVRVVAQRRDQVGMPRVRSPRASSGGAPPSGRRARGCPIPARRHPRPRRRSSCASSWARHRSPRQAHDRPSRSARLRRPSPEPGRPKANARRARRARSRFSA